MDYEQKEQLIAEVRMFPHLYNWLDPLFKNRKANADAWKTISEHLQQDVATCRSTWEVMRDYYHQLLRNYRKSTASDKHKHIKWHFFKQMSFMDDFYLVRGNSGTVPVVPSTNGSANSGPVSESEQNGRHRSLSLPQPVKRLRYDHEINTDEFGIFGKRLGNDNRMVPDEFDIFGKSVALALRQLPNRMAQVQLKRKIFNLISDAEMELIAADSVEPESV